MKIEKTKKEKSMQKRKDSEMNGMKIRKSKAPHILTFKKMRQSDDLLKSPDLLSFSKDFSPRSGSELKYNEKLWNEKENIRTTHNCYSYALGKIRAGLDSKAQPGYSSGFNHVENEDYNCSNFYERLKKDVPGSYLETFDNPCMPGFYKIFLMLDVGNDYHWAREDHDMYWSHKPGSTAVTRKDAKGNLIKNPLLSSWKYESLDYKKPCFFACVYSDLSTSISKIYQDDYFG